MSASRVGGLRKPALTSRRSAASGSQPYLPMEDFDLGLAADNAHRERSGHQPDWREELDGRNSFGVTGGEGREASVALRGMPTRAGAGVTKRLDPRRM
jgi:hypothetical protein